MLLTLSATCVRSLFRVPGSKPKKAAGPALDLLDLPRFAREDLGLSGLNLCTDLLRGADRACLDNFRERTDRASCSCLLLIESEPQSLGAEGESAAAASARRLFQVVEAAHVLGCSAAAARIQSDDSDAALARVASRLRPITERAEKLDVNLLISPAPGLTERPERITELLKKIGGFRVGTYPDFEAASKSKDPSTYLHRLTPYATVVSASTIKFEPAGKRAGEPGVEAFRSGHWVHKPYDLRGMVAAIESVGYDGPLAIDYRGTDDVTMGVRLSRDALHAVLGQAEEDELFEEP
jgi:sugar phosphate isomerase/epimerase